MTEARPLRILMDYRPALFGRGGIAVYTRELARGLRASCPSDPLLLWAHRLRAGRAEPVAAPPGARVLAGRLPSRLQTVLGRFGAGADVLAGGADVVHWTDYVDLPTTRAPVVATIHDVLFRDLPACYTPGMRRGLDRITRRIVDRAARICVPSARSRDALVVHYDARPDRVHVVPHGVRLLPASSPAQEHGRYVLYVGTLEPRKNLLRLLSAHEQAERRGLDARLVLAGPSGWLCEDVQAVIALRPSVVWEREPTPARLAALYQGALAFAYPSLGEGFGLPVLEAMAAGLASLVGSDTACSDLAEDAAVAVDPYDVDALAEGLLRLGEDNVLRTRLGARGLLRAASYTWEGAAESTRAVYARAVAS